MGGKQCFRRGSPRHLADKCSHVASACNCCGTPGHLAKERFKKRREELGGNNTTHQVSATPTSGTCTKEEQENSALSRIVSMKRLQSSGNSSITTPLYKLTVTIQDRGVPMEVDTGSSGTLLGSTDYTKLGGELTTLRPPTVLFKSCTGDIIQCLGEEEMDVKLRDQVGTLLIRVVQGPSLLVRDMMSKLTLPWQNIFSTISTAAEDIVQQYPNLFDTSSKAKLK